MAGFCVENLRLAFETPFRDGEEEGSWKIVERFRLVVDGFWNVNIANHSILEFAHAFQ